MSCTDSNASNNFILIDPNCEILTTQPWFSNLSNNDIGDDFRNRGIPKFEEIRSYVELSMIPKNPNYVLIEGNKKTVNSKKRNGRIILQGFKERNNNKFYSTDYTDELMGGEESNYEGFGIKNIEITFDANKVPLVSVTFYDLRGNVLNNFKSNFALMFQLPYPIFYLKIKGGFGPLVEYRLLKTRDDISVDEAGNYIITSKFIGDRFAPLSDVPLLYLMAIPYLTNKSVNIFDRSIDSFHELIVASKRLFEKANQVQNSDQTLEKEEQVKKIAEVVEQLELIKKDLNDVETVRKKFSEDEEITALSGDSRAVFNSFTNSFIKVSKDTSVNFGFPGSPDNQSFNDFFKNFNRIVNETIKTYNQNIKDVDSTIGNLLSTSNKIYEKADGTSTERIEKINFKDLSDRITLERNKLKSLSVNASVDLTNQLINLPTQFLGATNLTIGSIFNIIFKDYNILLEKIKKAGNDGYTEIKDGKRTQQTFDRMGFPTVIERDANGANKLIYPGIKTEFNNWPEVRLIEDFIVAYAKAAKASAIADVLSEVNNDGATKYAPINPREIYTITTNQGGQNSPENVYYGKTVSEIAKLIYERFLILTNVNLDIIDTTTSSDYEDWNLDTDEGRGSMTWIKECFFETKQINEVKKGAFNLAVSTEARNIAFAISVNPEIKNYFKGLYANFDNNYFQTHQNDEIVKAVNETDVSSNNLLLSKIGAFDDYYVTAGIAQPGLLSENNTSNDIITKFLSTINSDQTDKPFSVTKKNVIFIPDSLKNSRRDAVAPEKRASDLLEDVIAKTPTTSFLTPAIGRTLFFSVVNGIASILDDQNNQVSVASLDNIIVPEKRYSILSSDYDTDITRPPWYRKSIANPNYPSIKEQIEQTSDIYELYRYTNGDIFNKSVFDFDFLNRRLVYPSLVQVPRGMLIIMGSVLLSKIATGQINSNGYYKLELSGEAYYIKKDSKFYNLLIFEAETFNNVYGWSIYYQNGEYYNRRDYDPVTKRYKQELEATIEYLYLPSYICVNDHRFTDPGPTSTNLKLSKGPSDNGLYKKYLTSLFKKINEFVEKDEEELSTKLKSIDSHIKDPEVKLAIYKSFQVIYENYLHGISDESYKFVISDDDKSSFKFVDRAYNPIGSRCILDLKTLLNDVNDTDVSILSAISRLLSDNNFWFYPFQGWLTDKEKYNELFRIQFDEVRETKPVFVAMYVGGLSSNPSNTGNLDDFPIQDDSIKKNTIPSDFSKDSGNLHAFKVKFTGTQNQMVFSNLQVSTESLKNTDEGLRIQSDIINTASNSFSVPKGQSLLNVYQKQSYSSTVKIPFGNMGIQPTQYFYQEYMPLFDGLYIIYSVSHSIDSDTQRLETTFKGYRLKRDVNPIVEQQFVDFINDNFFTNTLDSFGITTSLSDVTGNRPFDPTKDIYYNYANYAGGYEGFIDYTMWDINSWRIGYGNQLCALNSAIKLFEAADPKWSDSNNFVTLSENPRKWPISVDLETGEVTYQDLPDVRSGNQSFKYVEFYQTYKEPSSTTRATRVQWNPTKKPGNYGGYIKRFYTQAHAKIANYKITHDQLKILNNSYPNFKSLSQKAQILALDILYGFGSFRSFMPNIKSGLNSGNDLTFVKGVLSDLITFAITPGYSGPAPSKENWSRKRYYNGCKFVIPDIYNRLQPQEKAEILSRAYNKQGGFKITQP